MDPKLQTSDFRLRTSARLAPTRAVLDNGAVVLTKETSTTPAVTIHLAVRAGSICDPADAPGAMYLVSRTIDRGTAARSAETIAEDLDNRGLGLQLTVTRQLFSIVCTCLADDFEAVFALMGEIVMSPSLPESELAARKSEVVTAIRQDEDNPAVRASETLMARLYPDGHPYGQPSKGTVEIVEALTRARLVDLHAQHFGPARLAMAVVGDVSSARVVDHAERVFGGWRASPAAPPAPPPAAAVPRRELLVVPMMNKAQADIAYGFVAIRRADPMYYAFTLMNNALGEYAIGGRLGDRIREREGMAYYVHSSLEANVAEGPLVIRAGVGPANVDRAIRSIDEELARLVEGGLTGMELADSRQYLIGSMPRTLETNAGIAAFLHNVEFFGLGLDYDVRLPDLLRAVTLDQVNAAARRVLDPERAAIVVAGPYQHDP